MGQSGSLGDHGERDSLTKVLVMAFTDKGMLRVLTLNNRLQRLSRALLLEEVHARRDQAGIYPKWNGRRRFLPCLTNSA